MKKILRIVYTILKRIIDIIISLVLLMLLLIPFIIIGIAIKLEDGGPVFFKQDRVGKKCKLFKIYKFRSMKTQREILNSSMTHEQMVTKVGKFIRKTSIDELPQLINVVKGQMSLIGPRPWIPEYYEWFTDEQKRRSEVLPGISGLAQAKGRNGINIFKRIEYDIEYVDHFGPIMDIKCIWLTIICMLFKGGEVEITEKGIKEELEELKIHKTNEDIKAG